MVKPLSTYAADVCKKFPVMFFAALYLSFGPASIALGMLEQTNGDLILLEDALQNKITTDESFTETVVPMLVATPAHLWTESQSDFAPAVWAIFKKTWSTAGNLIQCHDCNMQRLHVGRQHTISLDSGDLSSADLLALTTDPRYQGVKSVVFTRETASGVEIRILRISDGAILFQYLADGRVTLNQAKPALGLVKELDRRERGESLAYIFIDMGFYPAGLFHVSFLEQWGSRNQHISGVTLSLFNPTLALGLSYRYMLPFNRKVTVSGQLFFPLEAAISDKPATESMSASIGMQAAISSTFGVFVNVGSKGGASLGISLFNPVFFPFML
jgi:hypothetical protein